MNRPNSDILEIELAMELAFESLSLKVYERARATGTPVVVWDKESNSVLAIPCDSLVQHQRSRLIDSE